jgi:ABC-type lipopolysaccharide export system ATPase subunit
MSGTGLLDELDESGPGGALEGGPDGGGENGGDGVLRGLSVDGIGKKYDKRVVLRDVSLSVRRGEVVGLLGPNGAGKTTCFYSIMGLAMPDSGRILLDGHNITGLPMYRRAALGLGYLPQETSIFRGMTVEQNILSVLEVSEPDPEARQARLEQLLGEFHIARFRAASGGAARLRARWRPIRRSCCLMSRLPASIRFRSPISGRWWCSCATGTLAC